MILPSKHVSQDRALLTVGLRILQSLNEPKTVSSVWEDIPRRSKAGQHAPPSLSYDDFVLALDLLFLMGTLELMDGRLVRKAS